MKMRKQEYQVCKAAGQLSGIVRTIRYGDHITIKYWDLGDENDSAKLLDYKNRNQGKALIKQTLYL